MIVIASQLHPAAVILAVFCVLLIVYGRTLFRRLALFAGYFLLGFVLFIGAGLITTVPLEKSYPLSGQGSRCWVVCRVVPGDPGAAVHEAEAGDRSGGGGWASGGDELRKPALTFADVGGLEQAKKQIRELVQANLNGKKFGQYGVFRNGILLHGPRGTGKTFLAEAVAGEFKLKYLYVSAAESSPQYVGETEVILKHAVPAGDRKRPAVLFIDEIDALGDKATAAWRRGRHRRGGTKIQLDDNSVDGLYR